MSLNSKHNRNRNRNSNNRNENNKKGKKPFNRNRRGNKNYRGNKNRPRLSEWDKLEKSYLILMEKYLHARRKYHDQFHKVSGKQLEQLENNFYRTLDELRKFEDEIPEHLRDKFDIKGNSENVDTVYSSNHEIEPFPEVAPIPEEDIIDPHLLATQIQSDYKEDTEESVGSMDDYNKYKGL